MDAWAFEDREGMESGVGSGSRTAESLFGAGGVFEGLNGFNGTGEDGDGNHLGDFFAGLELDGGVAKVGHEDKNLAAVAGIDDAGRGGDSFASHGGAVANQEAERDSGGGMAGFDGDAGADPDSGAGSEQGGFESKQVIAEVLAGVGDDRGAGGWVQELYTEHGLMVTERG